MRRGVLILLAAALALPAGAAAATQAPDPGRYAPEVRLARGETLFPVRPEGFIAHSDLVWYGCGKSASVRYSAPDAARLGAGADDPYESPFYWADGRRGCPHAPLANQTVTFAANEWTRPFGGAPRSAPLRRYPANGFALDLLDEFRPGNHDLSRVPITYETGMVGDGWWITYWLFYAFNSRANANRHEGDWERVSVRFGSDAEPQRIAYYAHNGPPHVCRFDEVRRIAGRHPVVFSALGSHASYPSPRDRTGKTGKVDHTDNGGTRWRTWLSGMRSPRVAWYGFGGAWGERGNDSSTTGPPGPGQRTAHDWDRHKAKPCDAG